MTIFGKVSKKDPFLFWEKNEDLNKIDETEEIWVNGKKSTGWRDKKKVDFVKKFIYMWRIDYTGWINNISYFFPILFIIFPLLLTYIRNEISVVDKIQ